MSAIPKGVLAVFKAKEARERKKRELQLAIDKDVQKLKASAMERMEFIPDDEEYYTIVIEGREFEYDNAAVVIDTFCEQWEKEGFIVPKVKAKKSRADKANFVYTIRFRPSETSIELAQSRMKDLASVNAPSSGSSNVS